MTTLQGSARIVGGDALTASAEVTLPATQAGGLIYGSTEIAFDQINAALDGKLRVRRSYDGALPATVQGSKAWADMQAGRIPWVSFSSAADANMQRFFDSCAADGREVWVTLIHEVNLGKMAPDLFRLLSTKLAGARNAAGAGNVKLIPVLTAEPFRTGQHVPFFEPGTFDAIGVDAYRFWRPAGSPPDPKTGGLGQDRSMEWLIGQAVAFSSSTGKPIALGEYAAHPRPEDLGDRGRWLTQTDTFLRSIGALAAVYFHSPNGESGPWWLNAMHNFANPKDQSVADPRSVAAFRALLT